MAANKRAERIWLRLIQAYGSRVAESYGEDMPKPWTDAIEELTDEQIAYGLRKVSRDTPIHPPTLGQFVAACTDMPQAQTNRGPSIQEQLCAYASINLFSRIPPKLFSRPWDYIYREWIDENRPKHMQKCSECTGIMIHGDGETFRFSVAEMLADKVGHARAMRTFQPGKSPPKADWMDVTAKFAERMQT